MGRQTQRGVIGRRLGTVFRDRDELSSETDLSAAVRRSLEASEFLIVLCSPSSARSRWVNEEVLAFKRLGRADSILTLIVDDGSDGSGPAESCYCPALRFLLLENGELSDTPIEPLSADARSSGDGRRGALVKIIASLLGIKLDELQQRDAQRRYRRMTLIAIASTVGMLLTLALAVVAYVARNDADRRRDQAEGLLSFMVGDLSESLAPIGRLDLLEQVSDQATSYFSSVDPSDLTEQGLANQAKVLTQIGNIRLSKRRYANALEAFSEAFARSRALALRDPNNTDFLYERSQAEFWVGYVYWRLGQLNDAQEWLTDYRDSTLELLARDPNRRDWVFEVGSGNHNLAVLSLERNDLADAETGFEAERDTLLRLKGDEGPDAMLADQLAIAESWLGTTLQRQGRLKEAKQHFVQSASYRQTIVESDPENAIERYRWAVARLFVAYTGAILGDLEEASTGLSSLVETLRGLAAGDPANQEWQRTLAQALLRRSEVEAALADPSALKSAEEAVSILDRVAESLADDREGSRIGALAHLQLARILLARDPLSGAAGEQVRAALEALRPYRDMAATDPRIAGVLAQALVVSVVISRNQGDAEMAADSLGEARNALSAQVDGSAYDLVLDPWVRVLLLSGELDQAAQVSARLSASGYRPLVPWPEA